MSVLQGDEFSIRVALGNTDVSFSWSLETSASGNLTLHNSHTFCKTTVASETLN